MNGRFVEKIKVTDQWRSGGEKFRLADHRAGPAEMTRGDSGRDDALLLAHCRNNFGKALEAMREIADMIQYETSFESPAYKRCWELIAELQAIEEPEDAG